MTAIQPIDLRKVRSILSVPAHDERKVAGARSRGADLVMWDLEASVPDDRKDEALARVVEVACRGDAVRILPITPDAWLEQLLVRGLVFVVPNVTSILDLPRFDGAPIVALIESPAAVLQLDRLVRDTPYMWNLRGLAFGRWDFEFLVGFPCHRLLDHARAQVALVAHAAEIACWDAPALLTDSIDEPYASRFLGFTGKGCIHPTQIEHVHRAFKVPGDWDPLPFAAKESEIEVPV